MTRPSGLCGPSQQCAPLHISSTSRRRSHQCLHRSTASPPSAHRSRRHRHRHRHRHRPPSCESHACVRVCVEGENGMESMTSVSAESLSLSLSLSLCLSLPHALSSCALISWLPFASHAAVLSGSRGFRLTCARCVVGCCHCCFQCFFFCFCTQKSGAGREEEEEAAQKGRRQKGDLINMLIITAAFFPFPTFANCRFANCSRCGAVGRARVDQSRSSQ